MRVVVLITPSDGASPTGAVALYIEYRATAATAVRRWRKVPDQP